VYESDRALVAGMVAGQRRAFDEFFWMNAARLAAFVVRRSGLDSASVEDIVQNTLIKAMRNLTSFRGEASLLTWLTQICRHELADAARKAARRPGHDSLDEPDVAARASRQLRVPEHLEPEGQFEAEVQRAAVIRALNDLPEHYALALEAKYGDGLSVDEIAVLLGLTSIATQSLLARAREAFRKRWLDLPGNPRNTLAPT
jgi:RNA polymerase sigma-70 factor (ECF subfamily)